MSPTPDMVVLSELADTLIADLPHHAAGRTAKTVVTGDDLRAAVIALADGSSMTEHDSPSAATLYVIRGKVSLDTSPAASRESMLPVYPGQLVALPAQRHSIHAHADSAFLLTVALG